MQYDIALIKYLPMLPYMNCAILIKIAAGTTAGKKNIIGMDLHIYYELTNRTVN